MERKNYRALLTQKRYLRLLFADFISRFGDMLDAVAYSWIMYEVTGSESLMAFILGLNYIPTVLLQPFLGAAVDRVSKKWLMVVADALRFGIVAVLVSLYAVGRLTPAVIAALTLLTSTVEAFRLPAGNAVLPLLLAPEYYTLGKAASYTLSRAGQLLGLVAAGGIIAWIGSAGALWIDAFTFLISAIVIATIPLEERPTDKSAAPRHILSDFREGLSFLKGCKAMQLISLIGLAINFGLMPLSVFQTPYVSDCLGMGPETLSYIRILMIIGMMLGATVTPKLLSRPKSRICAAAGVGMGISIVCMFLTAKIENTAGLLILLTASMLGVGIGGGVINVIIGSSMMDAVPKEMMGRMSGLNSAIMEASMPIGSFLCSALVIHLSVIQLLLLFGICTILFYSGLFLSRRLSLLNIPSGASPD